VGREKERKKEGRKERRKGKKERNVHRLQQDSSSYVLDEAAPRPTRKWERESDEVWMRDVRCRVALQAVDVDCRAAISRERRDAVLVML
jgi:hypothetical protein